MADTSYSRQTSGPETSHSEPGISDACVREELDRVLASHEFQSSKLCQSFLRYVVENTLNGHHDTLKERMIGIEVFGKPTSYDPSEDAGFESRLARSESDSVPTTSAGLQMPRF